MIHQPNAMRSVTSGTLELYAVSDRDGSSIARKHDRKQTSGCRRQHAGKEGTRAEKCGECPSSGKGPPDRPQTAKRDEQCQPGEGAPGQRGQHRRVY